MSAASQLKMIQQNLLVYQHLELVHMKNLHTQLPAIDNLNLENKRKTKKENREEFTQYYQTVKNMKVNLSMDFLKVKA